MFSKVSGESWTCAHKYYSMHSWLSHFRSCPMYHICTAEAMTCKVCPNSAPCTVCMWQFCNTCMYLAVQTEEGSVGILFQVSSIQVTTVPSGKLHRRSCLTVCEKSVYKRHLNMSSVWAEFICLLHILLQICCLFLWDSRNRRLKEGIQVPQIASRQI